MHFIFPQFKSCWNVSDWLIYVRVKLASNFIKKVNVVSITIVSKVIEHNMQKFMETIIKTVCVYRTVFRYYTFFSVAIIPDIIYFFADVIQLFCGKMINLIITATHDCYIFKTMSKFKFIFVFGN